MVIRSLTLLLGLVVSGVVNAPAASAFDDFDRLGAVTFAKKFYNTAPLAFVGTNSAYFVSQALWDGGMAPTTEWAPNSSDKSKLATGLLNPGPTRAAASADHFKNFMVSSGRASIKQLDWSDPTAGGAELADIIAYDYIGPADGFVDHLAIVTGFTDDNHPLVTQQAPSRLNREWSWDLSVGRRIEFTHPGARAYLLHVN
ncbi:amidase domain-containing protein [Mycolicibacterium diernhoferi]|uniref:Putative amidase domain-containing protein n=1 Tax=Mycolicibacterium diernhoferi TaxID=1801 RepID=A0A1Q4H9G9_9MYCO|nr:amidase domain-containing protein [Mycolicibacterium diernhoferi]OJZ64062.1 hypothetical protein BRW64_20275 [Mycolicibacterium diernhoferi]OPE46424.1 hypothetical protein BV510_26440 [Mycolicibacterium diernhoferi]